MHEHSFITMSYLQTKGNEWEKKKRKKELQYLIQIRNMLELQNGKLVANYDIGRCLQGMSRDTIDLSTLLDHTPDVHRETVTGLYYVASPELRNSFQKNLSGNLEISNRQKIKQVVETAPKLLLEASTRGEHEAVLLELNYAEYKAAVIEEAVKDVLEKLYGVLVFVKKELNKGKLIQDSLSPFGFRYQECFFLCAQFFAPDSSLQHTEQMQELAHFYKLKIGAYAEEDDIHECRPSPQSSYVELFQDNNDDDGDDDNKKEKGMVSYMDPTQILTTEEEESLSTETTSESLSSIHTMNQ